MIIVNKNSFSLLLLPLQKANKYQKTVLQKKRGCSSVYMGQIIHVRECINRCGKHPRKTILLKIFVVLL